MLKVLTKDRIIEVATNLFLANGVKAVTVDEITAELSTSKRTIYNHFMDRTDLVKACIESHLANIRSENDEIIEDSENAIIAMGLIHQRIIHRSNSANSNFYRDILKYYPGVLKESYVKNGEFAIRELAFLAKWGIEDGLFRPDLDPKVTLKAVQTLLKLCRNNKSFPIKEFTLERLTLGIMIPYLRGMCTLRGIEEVEKHKELYYQ